MAGTPSLPSVTRFLRIRRSSVIAEVIALQHCRSTPDVDFLRKGKRTHHGRRLRKTLMSKIDEARRNGARLVPACRVVGLDPSSIRSGFLDCYTVEGEEEAPLAASSNTRQ